MLTTESADRLWMRFKDDATALDGKKRATISGKGALNTKITALLLGLVAAGGVPTHLRAQVDETTLEVDALDMMGIEVVLRNVLAGSLARRLGRPEGQVLPFAVVEFYLKDDALGDPMLAEDHVLALGLATADELAEIRRLTRRVNEILKDALAIHGITLVDFKLEFGRRHGQIVLGDEISPDTCRLWDTKTGEKMDKDRFRRDLGGLEEAYQEVLARLQRA
jgi:phosphoribosylaminoimidazole-succinocarboxamide synthase